jgi:hypothetical protein
MKPIRQSKAVSVVLLQYAVGCFSAIRNPATHEHREWDPQVAIECLAA